MSTDSPIFLVNMSLPEVQPQGGGGPPSPPRSSYSPTEHQSTPATATVPPNSKQSSEEITQEELDSKPWKYIGQLYQPHTANKRGKLTPCVKVIMATPHF